MICCSQIDKNKKITVIESKDAVNLSKTITTNVPSKGQSCMLHV